MSDLFQLSIISEVKREKGDKWYCYSLMCCEGLKNDEKMNILRFYLKKGIKIIFCPTFDKLGEYLNEITTASFAHSKKIASKE